MGRAIGAIGAGGAIGTIGTGLATGPGPGSGKDAFLEGAAAISVGEAMGFWIVFDGGPMGAGWGAPRPKCESKGEGDPKPLGRAEGASEGGGPCEIEGPGPKIPNGGGGA